MKKVFLFMFLIVICAFEVNAEACDAYDIKRLKEIAKGVEITYELQEPLVLEEGEIKDVYKINISGLTDEIAVFNVTDNENYDFNTNYNDFILYGGKRKLEIISLDCSNVLKEITLKLPVYNYYSDGLFCNDSNNKKLSVCEQWVEEKISEREFDYVFFGNSIEDNGFKFNSNLKYFILGFVIIFCVVCLIIFVKKKKERLI